jgi:hypothetical protein
MTLFVQAGSGGIGNHHRRRHANAEALQNDRHLQPDVALGPLTKQLIARDVFVSRYPIVKKPDTRFPSQRAK